LLGVLETSSIQEARACAHLLEKNGTLMSSDLFDQLSYFGQAEIIEALGGYGCYYVNAFQTEPIITARFSPLFPHIKACTMFAVLNELEQLDGSYHAQFPKATLVLQVPLGGKKGLFEFEMLIMQFYPWLSIQDTSTDQVAFSSIPSPKPADKVMPTAPKSSTADSAALAASVTSNAAVPTPNTSDTSIPRKKDSHSFFSRLFNRKK
jgi:hypothetical protein